MLIITLLAIVLLVAALGGGLRRFLGWPTSLEAAGRWCMGLLVVSVIVAGLPDLVRHFEDRGARFPPVDFVSLVAVLLIVGFAVLGYVAWTQAAVEREQRRELEERTRDDERRRALPPAPAVLPVPAVVPTEATAPIGAQGARATFVPRGTNDGGAGR